jgi:hypothetical protein
MSIVDLRKELKSVYSAKKKPMLVEVPSGKFLTILGKGDPNGEEYQSALKAIYGVAYTLKFHYKKEGKDFKVMPLEGLWSIEDGQFDLNNPAPREEWCWKSMIRIPNYIEAEVLRKILPELIEKRGEKVREVMIEEFDEGLSAQLLHIGPYSEELPTINMLHDWVIDQGYRLRGDHHEIYLSDPRWSKPENLKTILRHPVEKNK